MDQKVQCSGSLIGYKSKYVFFGQILKGQPLIPECIRRCPRFWRCSNGQNTEARTPGAYSPGSFGWYWGLFQMGFRNSCSDWFSGVIGRIFHLDFAIFQIWICVSIVDVRNLEAETCCVCQKDVFLLHWKQKSLTTVEQILRAQMCKVNLKSPFVLQSHNPIAVLYTWQVISQWETPRPSNLFSYS